MHRFFVFMHFLCNDTTYFKPMILPYCVYVLQSQRDLLLYHGFTTNLEHRIRNHNAGKTISTSKRRPLIVIYCEFFLSKKDALRHEAYFKTNQGKRMLKLILRSTFNEIDYPNR
ncbi:GIY-YIG nuclease family protein [uncultured Eudoraea sp.]|uniref:GIY-YIG nuclease family protein n=1 Tax=uncultured Eudoraea sp. TaxID=1035614 RepID=UPI002636DD6A|nr:GIY-YIG nuclease family protein [uncultured Eudoraea sp.]